MFPFFLFVFFFAFFFAFFFVFFFVFFVFFFTLEGRRYSMTDVHAYIHMQDSHLTINNAVEIVGKVQPDLSIKVFQATDFGENIGMINYLLDHLPQITCWSLRSSLLLIHPPRQIFPLLFFFLLLHPALAEVQTFFCKIFSLSDNQSRFHSRDSPSRSNPSLQRDLLRSS